MESTQEAPIIDPRLDDDHVLEKLQTICRRLDLPHHDRLPLGAPNEMCCVFGCALDGAVSALWVEEQEAGMSSLPMRHPDRPYSKVEFVLGWVDDEETRARDEQVAEVLAEELDGEIECREERLRVVVPGETREMLWMRRFDKRLKPHLIARDDHGEIRDVPRRWETTYLAEPA